MTHAPDDGCLSCHAGIEPMHSSAVVQLTCTDCHGGNGTTRDKKLAHVQPHPHRGRRGSGSRARRLLHRHRAPDRIRGRGEGGHQPVAGPLHLLAAVDRDRVPEQSLMRAQHV